MLDANKAKELSEEGSNSKVLNNVQEIDTILYEYAKLGFTNCSLDIPMKTAGATAQDLMNRGFKVFCTINYHKEVCEMEVEW